MFEEVATEAAIGGGRGQHLGLRDPGGGRLPRAGPSAAIVTQPRRHLRPPRRCPTAPTGCPPRSPFRPCPAAGAGWWGASSRARPHRLARWRPADALRRAGTSARSYAGHRHRRRTRTDPAAGPDGHHTGTDSGEPGGPARSRACSQSPAGRRPRTPVDQHPSPPRSPPSRRPTPAPRRSRHPPPRRPRGARARRARRACRGFTEDEDEDEETLLKRQEPDIAEKVIGEESQAAADHRRRAGPGRRDGPQVAPCPPPRARRPAAATRPRTHFATCPAGRDQGAGLGTHREQARRRHHQARQPRVRAGAHEPALQPGCHLRADLRQAGVREHAAAVHGQRSQGPAGGGR